MSFTPKYPPFETRNRIKAWCDAQERAQSDVRKKLYDWQVQSYDVDQILAELISENYINEERFARAFASGKFRIKKWGWKKIEMGLKQKQISKYSIALAKEEIDGAEVQEMLRAVLQQKRKFVKAKSPWELRQKLVRFALGRGFSFDEINAVLIQDFLED